MTAPRLVIFDVDGTLIDSQAHIAAAMDAAFAAHGMPAPTRARTLSIVGLSLPVAMAVLAPDAAPETHETLAEAYRDSFAALRARGESTLAPLFPGARAALDALSGRDDILLGIATGKSRRGMAHMFDEHGLGALFVTVQTGDDHPSKPHPAMVRTCLAETGIPAADAVIVGDTTYDIEMGRAAGVAGIGVGWGYHSADDLVRAGATEVLDDYAALPAALDRVWGAA
ncbi:HAD-IA family hydrolase [Rhodobacterales bacterium HKCCE2091]|nr:HAD-IA family hydrolase [Rhodobacterales bacterium HKCCE2091]